jgi:hypothetical protein
MFTVKLPGQPAHGWPEEEARARRLLRRMIIVPLLPNAILVCCHLS